MLQEIRKAIETKVPAIRAITRYQPVGGPGDVVYPPTYANNGDPRHHRVIEGKATNCVLLDSVASQANRMEEALVDTRIPRLEVQIGDYYVSSLTASHRFTDVTLRSCKGYPDKVLLGRDLQELFGYSPNSLLWGCWHSNRVGAHGLRVPRAMTSEIIAVGIEDAPHVGGKLDQLPFSVNTKVELVDSISGWRLAKKNESGKRPSEALLGSAFSKMGQILPRRGVTAQYSEQRTVISLVALQRLGLGDDASAALAAIGVASATLASRCMWLRSRCELIPDSDLEWEFVGSQDSHKCHNPGSLITAVEELVKSASLPWHGITTLAPGADLVKAVQEGEGAIGTKKLQEPE